MYIRPIVLFQAQPKGKEDSTTFEKLKEKLISSLRIKKQREGKKIWISKNDTGAVLRITSTRTTTVSFWFYPSGEGSAG